MPSRDRVLHEWWDHLRLGVGEVVNELDPEGLLDMGAPRDEYSSEVDALTSLVVRGGLSERAVLAVWERAFGPGSYLSQRPDTLTSMMRQLLKVHGEQPRP